MTDPSVTGPSWKLLQRVETTSLRRQGVFEALLQRLARSLSPRHFGGCGQSPRVAIRGGGYMQRLDEAPDPGEAEQVARE